MHNPRFSVVVPSFNQGSYLKTALDSILTQSYTNVDILVIDGASTDSSLDVLKKYRDENRLRWLSEGDGGQADAILKGFANASGDILYWLNSDDWIGADAFSRVAREAAAFPLVDVFYGSCNFTNEAGVVLKPYSTKEFDINSLVKGNFIAQPAVFFRRSVWETFGGVDPNLHFALDYDLWLRWALAGVAFRYIPGVRAFYRLHDHSKTSRIFGEAHDEVTGILARATKNGHLTGELVHAAQQAVRGFCLYSYSTLDFVRFWRQLAGYRRLGGLFDWYLLTIALRASLGRWTIKSLRGGKKRVRSQFFG